MNKKNQSGAALLVSLIMLVILTIIGVSSIEDITLQSNMTRNSQFKMQAFNTALSESEAQVPRLLTEIVLLQNAMNDPNNTVAIPDTDFVMASSSNPFDQSVDIIYMEPSTDAGDDTNFSQGSAVAGGYSMGSITEAAYDMNSVATLPNSGSKSDQIQGLRYTAPAG
jgi:type IV pilus assembly protein PilX